MITASLFSGIEGFGLAAEWMNWETAFHCEINPFCSSIIQDKWKNTTIYGDIKQTDFTIWRGRIDVLTGGFPCQPYSIAGQRKGLEDERHLWPEMLRAIREIQPGWIVGENVRGLINWSTGLVFHEVQSELEAEGYEVLPFLLPAAGVSAPHERYRIWFIAYSNNASNKRRTNGNREDKNETLRTNILSESSRFGSQSNAANTDKFIEDSTRFDSSNVSQFQTSGILNHHVANSISIGLREEDNGFRKSEFFNENGTVINWDNFPTQPPVCSRNDGFPTELLRQRIREDCMGILSEKEIDKIISKAAQDVRSNAIAGAGNAVSPQLVLQIFKAIENYSLTQDPGK